MTQVEEFEAIVKIHPYYHELVDTDVDEESGEEPETVIFEVVEVLDSDYNEFIEEQVHIETVTLKEIYAEPIEEQRRYKVKLTNEFNSDKGSHELNLINLIDVVI